MRTEFDLHAAMTLIADEAEVHVGETSLAVSTRPKRRAPKPAARWLIAAAVVALVCVGAALVRARFDSDRVATVGSHETISPRVRLFTLTDSTGITIRQGDATDQEQSWAVSVDNVVYGVDIATAASLAASGYRYPDTDPGTATKVDIKRSTGYRGCGGNSSDPSRCDKTHVVLAWQPTTQLWAQIHAPYRAPNTAGTTIREDQLRMVRLARTMDFDTTESLRTPVSLTSAPAGTHLVDFDLTYDRAVHGPNWALTLQYSARPAGYKTDNNVDIAVSGGPIPTNGQTGHAVSVDGHQAWVAGTRMWLDVGNGWHVVVSKQGATPTELGALALSVRVASTPTDPTTWFDADTALP